MMATNMDSDSEVHFKEKLQEKGWVNQFEEYAALGQWSEEEKATLLFLLLTGGARMYFVGLPEREKMAYSARVEAIRCSFGQETDKSITLQELAGLRRGECAGNVLAPSVDLRWSPMYSNDASRRRRWAKDRGDGMRLGAPDEEAP